MDSVFYLDSYNLICSNIHETFLNGNIKLLKNDKEIDFDLSCDNNQISLSFFDAYQKGDVLEVLHDNEKFDVVPRFIFQTKQYDDDCCPDLKTLGSFLYKNYTVFRLWSPNSDGAYVVINGEKYCMSYLGKGLYEASIKGYFEKASYHYEVKRNNEMVSFKDLFAYQNCEDNINSYVLDPKKLKYKNIKIKKEEYPILYEISIKDFSSDPNAPFVNKGKFLALLEENLTIDGKKIGVDYLKELGITHLQIMPINNFDLAGCDYGWGYNPLDYNSFYWDYVVGKDAYSPSNEFRKMVDYLHSIGIKVNLDVVYNHVYKIVSSTFEKMFPYYFFRYDAFGKAGDASYCGNELRTESKFLREYLKIIVERLISIYDIDGLRFDLAGIIDTDTINYLYSNAISVKKDFMMYGEGWNMGEILPSKKRTTIENANEINFFAFFNGEYRDGLKGNNFEKYTKGYLLGNRDLEELVKKGLSGNIINRNQSINYVECHDNYTFYDKVKFFGYDDDTTKKICKTGLASVILSCGIPFIHSGQEFLRTKKGIDNTYNSGIDINKLDWSLMIKNYDVVEYLKILIAIRKKYHNFNNIMTFSYYYDLLIASIDNIDIFINPTKYPYIYTNWITYKEIFLPNNEKLHDLSTFDIPEYSFIIAEKVSK